MRRVFEILGVDLLALIKATKYKGVPMRVARKIILHTLQGWVRGAPAAS